MVKIESQYLSREQKQVVNGICDLRKRRRPLNISAVRESHPKLLLAAYTAKPFLGWKQAIEATGLAYSKIKVSVPETVKCRICGATRKKLDQHILFHHKVSPEDYLSRYRGACLSSPAFRALHANSKHLLIPHWEPHWSPEYVLDRLYEFHGMGILLNPSHIEQEEVLCYRWALRFFKNWDVVLKALQMDPRKVRKAAQKKRWTKTTLTKEVRRLKMLGQDVNWTAMIEHDRSITWAAQRLFGTYDKMLSASGLNPKTIRKQPKPQNKYRTKSDIVNAVCRRKLKDLPINTNGVTKGETRDLSLYNRARRVFGTWGAAVKAAGFDYNKVSRRGNPYSTRKRTTAEIKRRHDTGLSLKVHDVRYGKNKDGQIHTAALRFFKSWQNALKKAGIAYEEVYPSNAKYASRDAIVAEIQKRNRKGVGLGSGVLCHGKHSDPALYMRARRLFDGGWEDAISIAGFSYKTTTGPSRKYPSKDDIVREIQRRLRKKLPLNAVALSSGSHSDPSLYGSGRSEFGSWREAVEAAGLEYEEVTIASKYATRKSILGEIKRRHTMGLPLNFKAIMCGHHRDPALQSRCSREFGGWRQAVEAAGISYGSVRLPRAKYATAESVISEIGRRHREGFPLTYDAVERGNSSDRPLMLASCKLYGSWKKGVRAAGLSSPEISEDFVARA